LAIRQVMLHLDAMVGTNKPRSNFHSEPIRSRIFTGHRPDLLTQWRHSPRSTIGSGRTLQSAKVSKTGGPDSSPTAATSGRRASMLTPTTGLPSSIDTS